MSGTVIAAIAVFGVLFMAWVIVPTILKNRHQKIGSEMEAEE